MTQDHDRLPVVLIAAIPVLAVRVGVGFVRFQSRRKRGVRRFRRELIAGGMPPAQAARLAQTYHEAGSLRTMLRRTPFGPAR